MTKSCAPGGVQNTEFSIGNRRAKACATGKNPTHCVIRVLWKLLWHSRVVDERGRRLKVKDPDGGYVVDLVKAFLAIST